MSFFTSSAGVAIAWIATVGSFLFAVYVHIRNTELKSTIENLTKINISHTKKIEKLEQTINDYSRKNVMQTGEKNIYTEKNSGGMNIKM